VSGWEWGAVAGLGAFGALLRFLLDAGLEGRVSGGFPLGTLAVNASGSLLLGLLAGLAASGETLVLAGSGALGSYTTFSTWMLESQRLTEDADLASAVANVILSLLAGVGAAALGRAIGAA
jgi:CrcB protein